MQLGNTWWSYARWKEARMPIPKAASKGEEEFAMHCQIYKIEVQREYRFLLGRKFRFDFAIPDAKLAIEIEGGIWTGGRHTRGAGYEKDLEKYNLAAMLGWKVLRFTPQMVHSGAAIDMVKEAL
jgi:very-short-patch-repair endonuclease